MFRNNFCCLSSAPAYSSASSSGNFQFSPGVLPNGDSGYGKALFENGTVYYDFPGAGKTVIGYYKNTEGTRTDIFCEFDKAQIGYVLEDGYVYLTRIGLFNRFQKNSYPPPFPNPVILEVGRMRFGTLNEAGSQANIGTYNGDMMGAAAAFVCLVYECHTYYKYQKFYEGWY